ncbi:MAG: hypothetical protein PHX83_12640 [Acidobacteriia bacterium]|nr:hypothetical protein [Terriglobia bacterium]
MTSQNLTPMEQRSLHLREPYGERSEVRLPVTVEWENPETHQRLQMSTWLFSCSEYGASFNSERIQFMEGMRLTLISHSNFRLDAIVQWVKQYSISAHEVGLQFDRSKNHRPPISRIFGD